MSSHIVTIGDLKDKKAEDPNEAFLRSLARLSVSGAKKSATGQTLSPELLADVNDKLAEHGFGFGDNDGGGNCFFLAVAEQILASGLIARINPEFAKQHEDYKPANRLQQIRELAGWLREQTAKYGELHDAIEYHAVFNTRDAKDPEERAKVAAQIAELKAIRHSGTFVDQFAMLNFIKKFRLNLNIISVGQNSSGALVMDNSRHISYRIEAARGQVSLVHLASIGSDHGGHYGSADSLSGASNAERRATLLKIIRPENVPYSEGPVRDEKAAKTERLARLNRFAGLGKQNPASQAKEKESAEEKLKAHKH